MFVCNIDNRANNDDNKDNNKILLVVLYLGPEGAKELYRLLVGFSSTLERLILKQNNLRDEGMQEIVRAINNGGLSKLR